MPNNKISNQDLREEVLNTIMTAVGIVLSIKKEGNVDQSRDRQCAVNVLDMLEQEGFKVIKDANRT